VVEAEETVTAFVPPNNGAGPLWCYGAPLLVRRGDELFLSVMETGRDVPPLCNTRWQLLRRDRRGWEVLQQAEQYRLYLKQTVQSPLIRDRFFPGRPIVHSLECCRLREGRVAARQTLVEGEPGEGDETPSNARFHATDGGRLLVVYACERRDAEGMARYENRLLQVLPAQEDSEPVTIPLQQPFTTFFTAAERGGSSPSRTLDLYGVGQEATLLRYAHIRLPATDDVMM
jgi:hypothetical protein